MHPGALFTPERFQEQVAFCLQPEAGLEIVTSIDGLFLNGGDQWLTLHAFRDHEGQPTAELNVMLDRLAEQSMVLGGTSAGAAVQSARAMISNGSNAEALTHGARVAAPPDPGCDRASTCPEGLNADSLTYHPPGGLGSVGFAVIDTHFSERRRQWRLARLLLDSQERFGIGVDETTALVIDPYETKGVYSLEVFGEQAAWLMDLQAASVKTSSPLHIEWARLVRIGAGERLLLDPQAEMDPGDLATPKLGDCPPVASDVSFNDLVSPDRAAMRSICLHLESVPGSGAQMIRLDDGSPGPREWRLKLFVAPTAPDRQQ
jgi:cyanophycinase